MSEGSTAPVAAKNNTSTIAVVVAGILLFVVCAMAYKDYVDSETEKERADWGARPSAYQQNPQNGFQQGQPNPNGQFQGQQYQNQPQQPQQQYQNQPQQPQQQNQNQQTAQNYQPPVVNAQRPQQQLQLPPQNPALPPQAGVNPAKPDFDVFSAPPIAKKKPSAAVERGKRELEQRRQERMLAEQQLQAIQNGNKSGAAVPAPGITSGPAAESVPGSAVASAGGTPGTVVPSGTGGTPAFGAEFLKGIDPELAHKMGPELLTKLKKEAAKDSVALQRIKNSPAIAQVSLFDSQWNFVQINGGKDRNLRMKQRLTIRRGAVILGVIEITELGDDYAVGELKGKKGRRDDELKPQPGDDLIPAELF